MQMPSATFENTYAEAKLEAISRSQAVIEFTLEGIIINANESFLSTMGYELHEIKGRHHSIFVDSVYARSAQYREFWEKLGRGEFETGEYKRLGKGGKEIWIQASYNPLLDKSRKPCCVIKVATDVTSQKLKNADYEGQIEAIGKSQAVIEFSLDGMIITANQNFLDAMGYKLEEVKGKHHSMFAEPGYAKTAEYKRFWNKLGRGEFDSGEYKRIGKGGKEVWINASYNPIFDMNGNPFKVVKYATDVTQRKLAAADTKGQLDAINRVQAVIQFNLDGTIITANQNFLDAMGYKLEEIQGKHHRMFVEPSFARSLDYGRFWEKLGRGEYESRVYKRLRRGGGEIYIQASYNPIFDLNGNPFKIVKFASDVTELMKTVEFSETTLAKMQNVSAAIEEMSASVGEISKNMSMSSQATDDISTKIAASGEASGRLIDTMQSMEAVVSLIRDIAGQVNLLALNATIEAARAGEAGKGFSVVASEVKNLARQTSQATDDIAEKIDTIQSITAEVADSIKDIVSSASSVNDYVNNAAGAVEQQRAVTMDISSNTREATRAVEEIGYRIKQLSEIV